tara:strand:+ start:79 stop:828 length:750 start_codon:yes stop_codon:yes gene_type:complete
MINARKKLGFYFLLKRGIWLTLLLGGLVYFVRFTKGAFYIDAYSFLLKPLLSGTAQKEWIQKSDQIEKNIRLQLLEEDNLRLRNILSLQSFNAEERISAAVISRSPQGWWQQLEINKGERDGINIGEAVIGPGGLVGIVDSSTYFTSRVRLLTDPGSKVGVWINRTKRHGVLTGIGTNRPRLNFLNKNSLAQVGDVVTTSPASTLLPPNLTIGIIQFVDEKALPSPYAFVQLTASPEAIDWVQVLRDND